MLLEYSIHKRNEILRALCEVLSETQACATYLAGKGYSYSKTPTSVDMYCIAAILGYVSFLKDEAKREGRRLLMGSVVFGSPLSCAIIGGNIEMVEFLTDPSTVPHVPVDKRDIEGVIARQNLPMLDLLLKLWIKEKAALEDGKGRVYLQEIENFVNIATELGGTDMKQCILSCADQPTIAKMQLNRRNMNTARDNRGSTIRTPDSTIMLSTKYM